MAVIFFFTELSNHLVVPLALSQLAAMIQEDGVPKSANHIWLPQDGALSTTTMADAMMPICQSHKDHSKTPIQNTKIKLKLYVRCIDKLM